MLSSTLASAATTAAHWGPGPGFGWWLLIPFFWILLFGLLFAFVGRRWRRGMAGPGWGYGGPHGGGRAAEATLAERFANGDIDEVEYRARLEVLRANREAPRS